MVLRIKNKIFIFEKTCMDPIEIFSLELIKELEKKFKNACCNKTAEAYLDCALLIKHKLKQIRKNENKQTTHSDN